MNDSFSILPFASESRETAIEVNSDGYFYIKKQMKIIIEGIVTSSRNGGFSVFIDSECLYSDSNDNNKIINNIKEMGYGVEKTKINRLKKQDSRLESVYIDVYGLLISW